MDRKGRLKAKCSQVGCIQIIDLFSTVSSVSVAYLEKCILSC